MVVIDTIYDMDNIHLFKGGSSKSLLNEPSIIKLKKTIKENIKPPTNNTKVYIIEFAINKNNDKLLRISCAQFTLTPKLILSTKDDDIAVTITYTKDELKKYGFKKIHLKKIMQAIKEDTISLENLTDSITHVLEVTK